LRLASDDTLPTHAGVVTGRIVDDKGAPVPAARVTLHGTDHSTQTSDSGSFAMRELPLGSQMLDIEKVGFSRTATPVTILGPQQPAVVSIALPAPPPRSGDAALAGVGFARRHAAGGGVFITADTIAQRKARYIADLQPLMPGMIMTPTSRGPLLMPTHSGVARCVWYVLDGALYRFYRPGQINDDVRAADILGIEYYEYGKVPKELMDVVTTRDYRRCAMIAIWTARSGGG